MLNVDLLSIRLRQYSAAWLASFAVVLLGDLVAGLFHMSLTAAADVLLLLALFALGVAFAVFVALTLLGRHNGLTKTVLLVLGAVLLLPLLWAPMLGAIASAFIGHVAIEYSTVYAGFRIVVGNVIFAIVSLFTHNAYVEAGIQVFQALAAVVGFVAAVAQIWQMVNPPGRRPAEG